MQRRGGVPGPRIEPSSDWRWQAWAVPVLARIREAGCRGIDASDLFTKHLPMRQRHALAWLEMHHKVYSVGSVWFATEHVKMKEAI